MTKPTLGLPSPAEQVTALGEGVFLSGAPRQGHPAGSRPCLSAREPPTGSPSRVNGERMRAYLYLYSKRVVDRVVNGGGVPDPLFWVCVCVRID